MAKPTASSYPTAETAPSDHVGQVNNESNGQLDHAASVTKLVFGRHLLVANAGDCRAVLCRKGDIAERGRVEQSGGFIKDGYLNGLLSVTQTLGDWELKMPQGSPSRLIAEPEFRQTILTGDDEFLYSYYL